MRTFKNWNRLSTDAIHSPFLKAFKTRWDKVLSNLVWSTDPALNRMLA